MTGLEISGTRSDRTTQFRIPNDQRTELSHSLTKGADPSAILPNIEVSPEGPVNPLLLKETMDSTFPDFGLAISLTVRLTVLETSIRLIRPGEPVQQRARTRPS